MRWGDWVKARGLSWEAAARLIDAPNATAAHRYAHGAIPRRGVMVKIYLATGGQVAPNDFYDLPSVPETAQADSQSEAA